MKEKIQIKEYQLFSSVEPKGVRGIPNWTNYLDVKDMQKVLTVNTHLSKSSTGGGLYFFARICGEILKLSLYDSQVAALNKKLNNYEILPINKISQI